MSTGFYPASSEDHPLGGKRCPERHPRNGTQCWGHADHVERDGSEHVVHLPGSSDDIVLTWATWCPDCGSPDPAKPRKVYPEHMRGELVAMDTVPGYDPRVRCTHKYHQEPT